MKDLWLVLCVVVDYYGVGVGDVEYVFGLFWCGDVVVG